MTPLDYSRPGTPEEYTCGNCGASGCKLWREYQTMFPQLLCADCACRDQGKLNNVDEQGFRVDAGLRVRTDQIGWFVPAVPDEGGEGFFWGYSSVPEEGQKWWRSLPLRPV